MPQPIGGSGRRAAAVLTLVVSAAACASEREATARSPFGATARAVAAVDGDSLAERSRALVLDDLATLANRLDTLRAAGAALDGSTATARRARTAFADARTAWKTVEWLIEAYTPTSAKQLNGPPLPEVEYTEGHQPVRPPEGFQVVEAMLWPDVLPEARSELVGEVATMQQTITRVRQILTANHLLDGIVWDAGRTELARIATLGLGGFDSPVAQRHLVEARDALRGLWRGVSPYAGYARGADANAWTRLEERLVSTDRALAQTTDPTRADHLALLTGHLLPLARAWHDVARTLGIVAPPELRPWRLAIATPFDSGAFDLGAYASPTALPASSERVALGEALAHATVLSADGTRSCVTCHVPTRAFADGQRVRAAVTGQPNARPRNTPTLLNAALQPGLFWDQRVAYLEDQVTDVVGNPAEMHGSLDAAVQRLDASPRVRERFRSAF
nr:cytochrome-c peroxidase [Gemmatimonadaceae bacterium]